MISSKKGYSKLLIKKSVNITTACFDAQVIQRKRELHLTLTPRMQHSYYANMRENVREPIVEEERKLSARVIYPKKDLCANKNAETLFPKKTRFLNGLRHLRSCLSGGGSKELLSKMHQENLELS